jgi:hypothetical protein
MGLGMDPFTGSRYAFASGNPLSGVELDGHYAVDVGGEKVAKTAVEVGSAVTKLSPWRLAFSAFMQVMEAQAAGPENEGGEQSLLGREVTFDSDRQFLSVGDDEMDRDSCGNGMNSVLYMPLDDSGRASGMTACLTNGGFDYLKPDGSRVFGNASAIEGSATIYDPKLKGKTPGLWESAPKDWSLGSGLDRGHLLARQLGGDGTDKRNLVPLYADVNRIDMREQESIVAEALAAPEATVFYSVVPNYDRDSGIPTSITMSAFYANGTPILNPNGDDGSAPGSVTLMNTP